MVFRVLKNVLYVAIGVASVWSNAMLITVLLKFENLRTTSNIFILNLALCDLTTVLTSIPFAVAIEETSAYPFGYVGCKLLMPTATAAINSAAFTLLLIAVERFYAIIYPMRARMQSCKTKCIVLCVLHGLSITSVIPYAIHQRYTKTNQTSQCLEIWPPKGEQAYTLFLFSIQYVIPLTLIVILYSISWNAIRKQNKVIIKMQQLQQRGGCHFSRSQSWDISMRKSDSSKSPVDGTDDESQMMKTSLSAYSFKSTQLESVDEVEPEHCTPSRNPPASDEESVKESFSTYSFRSGQLKSVKEDEMVEAAPIETASVETASLGTLPGSQEQVGSTDILAVEVEYEPDELVGNDGGNCAGAVTNGFAAETVKDSQIVENIPPVCHEADQDGNQLEQARVKKQYFKKFSLMWNFRPRKSRESSLDSDTPFDSVEHSLEDTERSHGKLVTNGGQHAQPKTTSQGMKCKISKVFTLDRGSNSGNYWKVSQSKSEHCLEQGSTVDETDKPSHNNGDCHKLRCFGTRRGIPQSSSSSALISFKEKAMCGGRTDMGLIDGKQMKESTSFPVFQTRESRAQIRPLSKIPLTDTDMGSSRFSQFASTARRRLTNAFRSTSHENVSLASIKRMKQTRRTLVMFTCVVIVFAVCMLPNQITWIWVAFKNERLSHLITTIFYFLTYTNSILNPWIYGAVNPSFRKAYKRVFLCQTKAVLRRVSEQRNSGKLSNLCLSRKISDQTDGMSRYESFELKRGAFSGKNRSTQKPF